MRRQPGDSMRPGGGWGWEWVEHRERAVLALPVSSMNTQCSPKIGYPSPWAHLSFFSCPTSQVAGLVASCFIFYLAT